MAEESKGNGMEIENEELRQSNFKKMLLWIIPVAVILIVIIIFGGNLFKSEDSRYNDLIKRADIAFNTEEYEEAKTGYMEALQIKPAEKYPRERILEIKGILEGRSKSGKYDQVLAKADSILSAVEGDDPQMTNKQYREAMRNYIKASKIKPGEKYPEEKISEIGNYLDGKTEKRPEATEEVTASRKMAVRGDESKPKTKSAATPVQEKTDPGAVESPSKTSRVESGKGKFYIIVGAFEIEKNALRYSKMLNDKGYDSQILAIKNGTLSAVTCGSFISMEEASKLLPDIKREINRDAWVMKH